MKISNKLSELTKYLLKDEAISGKLIIVAALLALVAANTPLAPWYDAFIHTKLTLGFGDWALAMSLQHWVSEGLMALFFLTIGLELKHELVHGDLRKPRVAALPVIAAIGGMLAPALIFVAFNYGMPTLHGWAIPTATDIALAVGVLTLLGKSVPSSVRVFLLALAIVDDILAVLVIALFYSGGIDIVALATVGGLGGVVLALGSVGKLRVWWVAFLGVAMWYFTLKSGVHATLAGALLGLLLPVAASGPGAQVSKRIDKAVVPLVTLGIVPLFAFVSTGVSFDMSQVSAATIATVGGGIVFGFVAGKFLGVLAATWLAVRFKLGKLPSGMGWNHVASVGALAGIGFTVAVFVADLAYINPAQLTVAKLSILLASLLAALLGFVIIRFVRVK